MPPLDSNQTTQVWTASQGTTRVARCTHWTLWSEVEEARVENSRGKESEKYEAANRGIAYSILLIWRKESMILTQDGVATTSSTNLGIWRQQHL